MPLLGAVAWLGAVTGTLATGVALVSIVAVSVLAAAAALVAGRGRREVVVAVAALVLVAATAGAVAALRADRIAHNPVADLAADGAAVTAVGTVASDPHVVSGGPQSFAGDQVVWRLTVRLVTGRGRTIDLAAPVLVLGGSDDARMPLGATVRLHGVLVPADDRDLAALLRPSGEAEVVEAPGPWWRAAGAVRQALRDSVAHRPADQRALVPALVDGDDAEVDPSLQDAFRATGLTHLLAVSGTNLTLVVGFLLALARWCRVRGRWLHLVAAVGIIGFVLIARTEPSVLRAAVMGTIGLVALGTDGRHRAVRGLGTAVVVLVLLDPALAVSAGFALSVLATGGILLLAPRWRDALARWLPRWLAEAIAVPAAAQLACTPLVAAISGQVSLVAVVANLLVAPVVGPATVLGLAGGLLTLVWPPVGRLCGTFASWCVAWLIAVAEHGAALPTAAVGWGTGGAALAVLTLLTVLVAVLGPTLLRRPVTGLGAALLLVVAVLVRPPTFGWPPDGWVLVACDIGQPPVYLMTMKKAAIYVRVSQNRDDDRAKPERQLKSCRHLIAARDLEEVAVYTDDDISAYKAKLRRPGYEALLAAIKDGEVDVVVPWHIDRMLRTTKEMIQFIELAEETGVTLDSVQGGTIDLGTAAGRMMAMILAAVAQAEAELKAERHKLRNAHAVQEGKSTGGPLPFGWQSPAQEAALKSGIKAYLAGDPLNSIARTWNEAGLKTTFGKPWTHDAVRKSLIRPRNAGLVEYQKKIVDGVKGQWKALCTEDEWRSCKAIADAGKRPFRPPAHLLSNLIQCSNGHKMVAGQRGSGRYEYPVYRCLTPGCRLSIRRDHLDTHIRTLIRHRLTFEDISALAPSTHKAVTLKDQRGQLLAERKDYEDLLAEKLLTVAGFKKAVANVDTTLKKLDEQIGRLEAENAFAKFIADRLDSMSFEDAARIGKKFDSLDLDERRGIVQHLFPSITVLKIGRGRGHRATMNERVQVKTQTGETYEIEEDPEDS